MEWIAFLGFLLPLPGWSEEDMKSIRWMSAWGDSCCWEKRVPNSERGPVSAMAVPERNRVAVVAVESLYDPSITISDVAQVFGGICRQTPQGDTELYCSGSSGLGLIFRTCGKFVVYTSTSADSDGAAVHACNLLERAAQWR